MRRERALRLARRLRYPPAHWRLLAFCLVVVLAAIMFEGFVTHTIGASSEPSLQAGAPAPLLHQRPILNANGDSLSSRQPAPGRRIALTFDDGPSPNWTPKIAAVLKREGVPATFFVVGSQAARHQDLLRQLVADGNELGNHTFTHTSLSDGPMWQRRAQLELTEGVIVGATGHFTRLVRPPYSATSDAIDPHQERELARVAGKRYLIVLTDYDSKDWERHGVPSILRNATPKGGRGGVIMFHDGGGNRSETVTAVSELIPRLKARGFRFVTMSQLAGLPRSVTEPVAPTAERVRGEIFTWAVSLAFFLTALFSVLIIAVGILVALRALLLMTLASHQTRIYRRRAGGQPLHLPSVSVIVPAYNEEVGIERAVRSLAASDYPDLEVVVVDDGSTDRTAEIVEGLGLPRVHLVRQDNGGKAAALNTGTRLSKGDVLVMVDGDTVFESDTIEHLVQPLADPEVAAVSGNTKVGNRGRLLGRWQHIEYVTGFNLDRRMYEVLQCTPTVPGAIGAFRRDVLERVGGVSGDTLAEDTDLTLAVGRTGGRVVYAPDARAWTEAPSTVSGLWRQRYRWSFGTMQAVWKHRDAIVSRNPHDRRIGRRALPYMVFFQILLPIIAPLIDLFALYGLIFEDPLRTIAFWLAFNVLQIGVAAYGFRLDGESPRVLWAMPLQQFVYRQLMYLVIIESTISALVGVRAHWQHIPRTGDVEVVAAAGHAPRPDRI
jgi:cellulose synthase/poly-beta-1,6-N-acetylglucosamine synthase-like glycosyltransferase/peptidoglycan/xylan/chitin deacetylase (PgdA/CDA1 family)